MYGLTHNIMLNADILLNDFKILDYKSNLTYYSNPFSVHCKKLVYKTNEGSWALSS